MQSLLFQFGRYRLLYLWTIYMLVLAVLLFPCALLPGSTHLVINSTMGLINTLRWSDYVLIIITSFRLWAKLQLWFVTVRLNTAAVMHESFHRIW